MAATDTTAPQRVVRWVLGTESTLPISADDYAKARQERESVTRRLREETLFDQLATNVIEWHEAMVRFAARFSSGVATSSRETWARTERECSLMLRVANVLSAALSFTDAVERDGRHRNHACGKPICTIARALRNRLQHDVLAHGHCYFPITVSEDSPQMRTMPSNDRRDLVVLRVGLEDILDDLRNENSRKRFEAACRRTFPGLDEIDTTIVLNGHLDCLSSVMAKERQERPPHALIRFHDELSKQAGSWALTRVSPDGKTIERRRARDILDQIEELMNRNEKLPDLELVQLSGGRPAPGGLEKLNERLDRLVNMLNDKDILLRDAIDELDLDFLEPPREGRGTQRLATEVAQQLRRALDAERELIRSSRLLRQLEDRLSTAPAANDVTADK